MNVETDRALVAADTPAVRYCTVLVQAPAEAAADPRDAELIIRDSRGVKTMCLNDLPTDEDVDGLHIRLGDLAAGQDVTLVLVTEIGARAEGASTAILLRLADRDRVLYGAPMDVPWRVVDAATNRAQPVNRNVVAAAATLLAARARDEARALDRVGATARAHGVRSRAVAKIRELAGGVREINAIANDLEDVALQSFIFPPASPPPSSCAPLRAS
jgi:hypothetical protein